jgi:uncharacterized membrane protein YczE
VSHASHNAPTEGLGLTRVPRRTPYAPKPSVGPGRARVASSAVPTVEVSSPTRAYAPRSVGADWCIRLSRCIVGLAMFGVGIGLILEARLGAAPWDVFHQGVADKTGMSVGNVIIVTGLVLLVLWIPLRQRPGVGTLLNALEIGVAVDIVMPLIPDAGALVVRVVYLVAGLLVIAVGSGLYIGSGLGPGPRDGLMMGLKERGISVRVARTGIELTVLVLGVLLGGTVGIGTVAFTFGIGPLVQVFLPRFTLPPRNSVYIPRRS